MSESTGLNSDSVPGPLGLIDMTNINRLTLAPQSPLQPSETEVETPTRPSFAQIAHLPQQKSRFLDIQIRLGRILFPRSISFRTVRLSPRILVKYGFQVDRSEAETMRFIADHTSIPLPKVHDCYSHNGLTHIFMQFIEGEELASAWHSMSQQKKFRVVAQLQRYLKELRELPSSTGGAVCNISGGALRDAPRIGENPFGPFSSHGDFHAFIRNHVPLEKFRRLSQATINSHTREYSTKFTHGDFAPRNILVKKDGTIAAILDWECAGWFPEYWEFTKAHFSPCAARDWVSLIGSMTDRYDEQLEGEQALWKYCGEPGNPFTV